MVDKFNGKATADGVDHAGQAQESPAPKSAMRQFLDEVDDFRDLDAMLATDFREFDSLLGLDP